MSDRSAAWLCSNTYDDRAWSGWDHWLEAGGVAGGVLYDHGNTVVAFRGSKVVEDWIRDLIALPVWHPTLGWVDAGFLDGVEAFVAGLLPMIRGDVALLTGHSLGAAHATYVAGLLVAAGRAPKNLTLFGCPRSGRQTLGDLLSGVSATSFRNGADPVPLVPHFVMSDAVPLTQVSSPENTEDPIENHSILRYRQAV